MTRWQSRPFIWQELRAVEAERDELKAETIRLALRVRELEADLERLRSEPPTVDN